MQKQLENAVSCAECQYCTWDCSKLIDNLQGKENLVLFGCGADGQSALDLLINSGIKVKWLSDNNKKLWGKKIDGIKIINPDELKDKDVSVFIASSVYHSEIDAQLYKMGMKAINSKLNIWQISGNYEILRNWMYKKIHSRPIDRYLKENYYKSIAIYGMGEIGQLFLWEIEQTEIVVKYAIVQNQEYTFAEVPIMQLSDELPIVDAIVVCDTFGIEEIQNNLSQKVQFPIISIGKLIYEA